MAQFNFFHLATVHYLGLNHARNLRVAYHSCKYINYLTYPFNLSYSKRLLVYSNPLSFNACCICFISSALNSTNITNIHKIFEKKKLFPIFFCLRINFFYYCWDSILPCHPFYQIVWIFTTPFRTCYVKRLFTISSITKSIFQAVITSFSI